MVNLMGLFISFAANMIITDNFFSTSFDCTLQARKINFKSCKYKISVNQREH